MKAIIFDYNRTLNDPDNNPETTILPEALETIRTLRARGYRIFVYAKGDEGRLDLLEKAGLFDDVCIVAEKSLESMRAFAQKHDLTKPDFYVVGDRVVKEIAYGNALGAITVWLKKGKFADEAPTSREQQPGYIITKIDELENMITFS